jgi:tetratricopeptide (TPR) repeat protein
LAYNNRGYLKLLQKDYSGAQRDVNRAIALDPASSMAYKNRGLIHREKGNIEAALNDFNQALDLDPRNQMAYLGRGEVKEGRGDLAGALADYQKALDIEPANSETAKQVEALKSKIASGSTSKPGAPKTALKKPALPAKPKPKRIDPLDQMELLPLFGPK